jgi:hypothetical protein
VATPGSPSSSKKVAYKNYHPTENDLKNQENYVYKFAPPDASNASPQVTPGRLGSLKKTVADVVPSDPELLAKQLDRMKNTPLPLSNIPLKRPVEEIEERLDSSPVKKHRGFGASAQMYNADNSIDVGEFRTHWRCSWCLLSGKYTPTLRRGPLGGKSLCNACGIWYAKNGTLPESRFHEHQDSTS